MPEIVVLGEALIDLFAGGGIRLAEAKTLYPSPGGAPANVAVALARLEADVGFIGKVGIDDYGSYLINLLDSEGVETIYMLADPGGPTMLAIVAVPSPSEQSFILYNGANTLLSSQELDKEYIASANIFVYGSVTLASASREAALQAANWARNTGRQVIFDVNLRPLIWPSLDVARQRTLEALSTATVVKLNRREMEFLTDSDDLTLGTNRLLSKDIQLCCVSLGDRGAFFNNGRLSGYLPALPVPVKDTTGSGDAFMAGLAFQLNRIQTEPSDLEQHSLREIISFANCCGALSATKHGAMGGLPTLAMVEDFLAVIGS